MSEDISTSGLPVNIDDLVNHRTIEGNRVELKATWDDRIRPAIVRTVSAFANDLLNLNGGYLIIGIEEQDGRPALPPRGLDNFSIDDVQKQLRGDFMRIQPAYQPVLFPSVYQGKTILIIWAPGGDTRPYQSPENLLERGSQYGYFVRQGPQTVHAVGDTLRQLMESAAKVPFDDRRSTLGRIEDLSPTLTRRFLHDIRSGLSSEDCPIDDPTLFRSLRIVSRINSHEVPRNVGLMFFNENPDAFFPGARIEVVQFSDDAGGDLIEERPFRGPLHEQIRLTLNYLDSIGGTLLQKVPGQAEVERAVAYPYEAMEEAIVNAVYHRGYDGPSEPVKVYLYPDRMEVISYPGPVTGVRVEELNDTKVVPAAPARNRRIGDFLKELRLAEGRGTGIPKIQRKMKENGSPKAKFEFDADRTFFRAILPVHPRYQVLHASREAAHLWAVGERPQAINHLRRTIEDQPSSGALSAQLIEYAFQQDDPDLAKQTLNSFERQTNRTETSRPYLAMSRNLIDRNLPRDAAEILRRMPPSRSPAETTEAAVLRKRTGDFEGAHHLFAEAYSLDPNDPRIVHEFAQTKGRLARQLSRRSDLTTKTRLNRECAELLRRAIHLTDDNVRKAWCWYDLARALDRLRDPQSEVEACFIQARYLLPDERRFDMGYQQWMARNQGKPRK